MGRRWTKEENDFMLENYRDKGVDYCVERLDRTRQAVMIHANKVLHIKTSHFFSDDEKAFIERYSGKSNKWIAKKLNRSYDSVKQKRTKGGFETVIYSREDEYCMAEVARMLGRGKSTVSDWVYKGEIKAKKVGPYRFIRKKELFRFMQSNPNRWDATECEEWFFEGYDWFREKLKHDSLKKRQKRWGKYYKVV